ncbi:MAG: YeeE/YedE family protein [Chloroflexi bacterium]|nr:YeeE/YedE family protein [Chloroflexota bacterium]MBI4507518.1 YeeE/YedE family protein [Chloroflexota bacterium]
MSGVGFLVGAGFGFALAAARLNDYDVIHNMLLLRELDVFLLMASAIAVAAPTLWVLSRRRWHTPLGGPLALQRCAVERKTVVGAMMFGTGWALAGTCPGPALAMVAGGGLLGLVVMVGLVAGLSLRDAVAARSSAPRAQRPLDRSIALGR